MDHTRIGLKITRILKNFIMKLDIFCLSAKARKKLYVAIKTMCLLSTALSAVYLGVASYSLYRHRFLLHDLIISLFDDMYKIIIPLGVLLFLISLVAFKYNMNLKNQPTNHSLSRTNRILWVFSVLTLLATVNCIILIFYSKAVVDAQVGSRLKHGLSHYMDTHSWGSALDNIQNFLQCCGVHGPADWYSTAWIPMDRLAGHNVNYKLVQPNGRVQVPLVPTSCCRVASAECGHKAWMETKTRSWTDIQPAGVSLLHTVGCEEAIKATVARDIYIFTIILVIECILQVVLMVALKVLYTSTTSSVMLGCPKGVAPAWIINPRMFGLKPRYGFLQEYYNRCQNVESNVELEDGKSHKKRWKCMSNMRCRKTGKGAISEETESSGGKRRRSKSPCLAKLRSPCVKKLKECSRRFGGKKKKEVDYKALETESDVGPESEDERKIRVSDLNPKQKPILKNPIESEQFRVHTDIRRNPFETSSSVRKKISGNLIDVEDVFDQQHKQIDVYRTGGNAVSPFSEKTAERKSPKSQSSAGKGGPKRHESMIVNDFKKRRELFENAAKIKSKRDSVKIDRVQEAITPPLRHQLNLIDLDGIESTRSLSRGGTSGTDITTLSSVRHEGKLYPEALRNYPPLSPSE